MKDLTIRRHF